MIKKILVFIMCICFTLTSYANEQTGIVKFLMNDVDTGIELYKIADGESPSYVVDDDFTELNIDLSDLNLYEIENYIKNNEINPDYKETPNNREIIMRGLQKGLYFMRFIENDKWKSNPFVFSVPYKNPETGELKYFFEIEPKYEEIDNVERPDKNTNFNEGSNNETKPSESITYIENETETEIETETSSETNETIEDINNDIEENNNLIFPKAGDDILIPIGLFMISLSGIMFIFKKRKS